MILRILLFLRVYSDSETIETDIQQDDIDLDLDLGQVMSELLTLSEDDYKQIVDEIMDTVQRMWHGGLCHGDTCKICLRRLPILGAGKI